MKHELLTDSVSVLSGAFALTDIENILSIIILVISILNILYNMIYRIIKHVKNKQYDEISNDFDIAKNELEEIKEKEKN